MSLAGTHDTTHDMYLPARRAKQTTRPLYPAPAVTPDKGGSKAEREAWMRRKQAAGRERSRGARVEFILRNTCQHFGVTRAQVLGDSKSQSITRARGQICRDLRAILGMNSPEIARVLNFVCHSSVLYHWSQEPSE
jgi:hypothetical protein